MQYFVASLLTLLGLTNSLQCTEVSGGHNSWSSGPRVRLEVNPRIEEWPHSGPGKKLVLHKKNEPLNMTCMVVYQNGEKDDDTPFDYIVDWKGPPHIDKNPKIERGQSKNTAWIWFERLAEKDAGDYTCIAVSHKSWEHQPTLSVLFYLFVEHKPTYCGSQWFRCHSKNCIMERYVCDGKQDCEEGEDESPAAGCGLNPCLGKVLCEDRCIPPEWCCDHRNCSGTFGLRPWPHENHEISYVQTAFYTVIGCAMAFMFIVTILVIAICRVQIKRAMNSRCSQQNRNVICGRRAVPLYDLDVYLNRTADVNYPGGVSIMYNINSGVQFVGRPTEPPPYSEVISEPPREGPPPPYVSCENLIVRVPNPRYLENTEIQSSQNDVTSDSSLNRNVIETAVSETETDLINATSVNNQHENSNSNLPGPQVQTYTCIPQIHGNGINRDNDSSNLSRITSVNLQNRDNVDAPMINSESSRIHGNFELEYVETDALLADNTNNCGPIQRSSKDTTIAWKPYSRHALARSRWLSNERRDNKRTDKNWYRQKFDKTIRESPITSCHKDSENEGVFLDTDQQDSTSTEFNIVDNDVTNDFKQFASMIDAATIGTTAAQAATATATATLTTNSQTNDDSLTPSCSSSMVIDVTASDLGVIDDESIKSKDNRDNSGETRNKIPDIKLFLDKNDNERLIKKSTAARHFLRGIKRQSSLTNEETSKNISDTSVCASTSSVDLPNPRTDVDEANSLVRQSSLVLPLRESFIGVQRDS